MYKFIVITINNLLFYFNESNLITRKQSSPRISRPTICRFELGPDIITCLALTRRRASLGSTVIRRTTRANTTTLDCVFFCSFAAWLQWPNLTTAKGYPSFWTLVSTIFRNLTQSSLIPFGCWIVPTPASRFLVQLTTPAPLNPESLEKEKLLQLLLTRRSESGSRKHLPFLTNKKELLISVTR